MAGVGSRSAGDGAPRALARLWVRTEEGQFFPLRGKAQYLLGRRDRAQGIWPDVDLADLDAEAPTVSRCHALIHVMDDGVYVEDLESCNETIHNGYRLLPHQLYRLTDGDELRLGQVVLFILLA